MPATPLSLVRQIVPGQRTLSASDLNALINFAQRHRFNFVASGHLQTGDSGTAFTNVDWEHRMWPAKIQALGPGSEADYSDERYWVQRVRCSLAAGNESTVLTFEVITDAELEYLYTTATHLEEVDATLQHEMAAGNYVVVQELWDKQTPGIRHYFFTGGILPLGLAELAMAATGYKVWGIWTYPSGIPTFAGVLPIVTAADISGIAAQLAPGQMFIYEPP